MRTEKLNFEMTAQTRSVRFLNTKLNGSNAAGTNGMDNGQAYLICQETFGSLTRHVLMFCCLFAVFRAKLKIEKCISK